MSTLLWIITSGLLMSAIALVGSVTLILQESTLQRIILPLVAFSAGSLIGGAFFHMIPAGLDAYGSGTGFFAWLLAGFSVFFALEQFLHWHHCHRATASCKKPLTYLILIGDGLHNFIGGLAIAGTFLNDGNISIEGGHTGIAVSAGASFTNDANGTTTVTGAFLNQPGKK